MTAAREAPRRVEVTVGAAGAPIATWSRCGHRVVLDHPKPGQWIAIGNADPCPVCEGGDMPRVKGP